MNIGIYQSAASLSALEKWQDAVSQNITSASVDGYRKRMVAFNAQSAGSWQVGDSGDSSTTVSAIFPAPVSAISYQSGDTQHTGRDLDVAIQGQGFFQIQTPDGTKLYTRNGQFNVRADHTLVTSSGAVLMSDTGSPITLLPNSDRVTINQDGSIVQGSTTVGKIAVESFADNRVLVPQGDGVFAAAAGSQPVPVAKPQLLQGYQEASNVNAMHEMVDMVLISRFYEANQKVITTADQRGQKALDELG